jgi:glutathione S-transferase
LPTGDLKKEALHEQAESIETSNYNPYATDIAFQSIFTPMIGGKTDKVRLEQCASILEDKLVGYERILSKTKFLAGDEITLADLSHLPHGVFLIQSGFTWLEDEAKFPNVAR